MKQSHASMFGIAAAGLLIATYAVVSLSPLVYHMVLVEIFPSSISWDGHTAFARCPSAIAGRTSWPDSPSAACEAMHLCANEARLSAVQKKSLGQIIRTTPGCEPP